MKLKKIIQKNITSKLSKFILENFEIDEINYDVFFCKFTIYLDYDWFESHYPEKIKNNERALFSYKFLDTIITEKFPDKIWTNSVKYYNFSKKDLVKYRNFCPSFKKVYDFEIEDILVGNKISVGYENHPNIFPEMIEKYSVINPKMSKNLNLTEEWVSKNFYRLFSSDLISNPNLTCSFIISEIQKNKRICNNSNIRELLVQPNLTIKNFKKNFDLIYDLVTFPELIFGNPNFRYRDFKKIKKFIIRKTRYQYIEIIDVLYNELNLENYFIEKKIRKKYFSLIKNISLL